MPETKIKFQKHSANTLKYTPQKSKTNAFINNSVFNNSVLLFGNNSNAPSQIDIKIIMIMIFVSIGFGCGGFIIIIVIKKYCYKTTNVPNNAIRVMENGKKKIDNF